MSWTAAALIALIAGAGAAYHFGWYPAEWDALPARLAKADQDPPGTAKASETQPVLEPPEETAKAVDDETSIDFFTPVDDTTLVSESTPDAPPPGEDSTADLTDTPQPTADDQPPVGDAAATDEVETAVAPPEPTPPPPSDFVVQVDPPVAGARVWLGPRADLAVDANGRLVLRDLPIGGHDLTVQAPGHRAHTTRVEITSDGGSSRVTLEPLLATIAVSARPGTVISAVDANGRIAPLGSTGESGTFNGSDILPVGRYSMLFEHPDCAPVQMKDVELTATRRGTFAPEQQPLPGELRVLTNPDGAEVRLNGQAVGFTPLMLTELPSEVGVRIDVASPGFQELTQEVTLRPRETRLLNFGTLVADSGAVRFELSPPNFDIGNARMLVDDEDVVPRLDGSTWRIDGLVPGSHKIEIIHPDFVPWSQQIAVVNGRTTSLPVRFSAKMATVRLRVSGAPSFVLSVDGRQVDARSEAVSIPSGRDVRLEVTANGFRPASRVLHLAPDASETWAVELQRMDRAVEGEPFLALSVGLQMAWIPPGRFVMGSPQSESGPDSDERPLTRVKLTRGYWMGSTEVTQAQWSAVMDQNPSFFRTNTRAPVDSITWEEAVMFCRRLTQNERAAGRLPYNYSFALPTEAQWEYACRAGTTSAFHGDLGAIAWWKVKNTQPVGEKQPNAWGLHDMHGNVAEWTSSWYGNYPGGERTDYAGPGGGRVRVFRGGSIDSNEHSLRSAYRNWVSPATRDEVIGFRVALVRE